ncbi:MAG: DMT family transporter [Hyphomicrobiales bacterium]|nr:DMT family transporter [Hyphomicrobiales bacterium]MDE2115129.1 DMT family transporter [Hyphomicrobiales bacterium]
MVEVAQPAPNTNLPLKADSAALMTLIVAALAMGCSPIFVRIADIGPFTSAFWRVALALPVLWLWLKIDTRRQGGAPDASFSRPIIYAGLAFTGDLFFWHLSILHTSVANATFFATTAPVFVALFSWWLFGHRPLLASMFGLALCLIGGAALVAQSMEFRPDHVLGDMFGLITAVFFGLYFLAVNAARKSSSAARVTFEGALITAACLGVIAYVFEPQFLPHTWHSAVALLALALISHAGGQGLLALALGRLPTLFSSLVIFLEAIAAAALAWIFLNEPVSPIQFMGGLLILGGIYIARPK